MTESNASLSIEEKEGVLLNNLSLKEKALFRLVKYLAEEENKPRGESDPRIIIRFEYELTANQILDATLDRGYGSYLPTPYGEDYQDFSWMTGYEDRPEIRKKYPDYDSYKKDYPTIGSRDIRVLNHHGKNSDPLLFFANTGSFTGMEAELKEAFEGEPFPIIVRDRNGFEYKNPAFSQLPPTE